MAKIVTREEQTASPLDQLISLPDETTDDARSAALGRTQSDDQSDNSKQVNKLLAYFFAQKNTYNVCVFKTNQ